MKRSEIVERLRRLTDTELTSDQYSAFMEEVNSETNHRGAPILISVNVELALQFALSDYFATDRMNKLSGAESPLGSFRNKILVGYALNIFGDEMYHNLELVRHIRNTFAHAQVPISFDTMEIADACTAMKMPKVIPPHVVGANERDLSTLVGLPLYREVCDRCGHNLLIRGMMGSQELKSQLNTVKILDPAFTNIMARAAPLP